MSTMSKEDLISKIQAMDFSHADISCELGRRDDMFDQDVEPNGMHYGYTVRTIPAAKVRMDIVIFMNDEDRFKASRSR